MAGGMAALAGGRPPFGDLGGRALVVFVAGLLTHCLPTAAVNGCCRCCNCCLQSCGMLGVFSYFIDSMGGGVAEAATVAGGGGSLSRGSSKGRSSGSSAGSSGVQQLPWWQQGPQQCRGAVESLLSPALPLLAAVAPCSFGASSSQEGGCAVVRRRR